MCKPCACTYRLMKDNFKGRYYPNFTFYSSLVQPSLFYSILSISKDYCYTMKLISGPNLCDHSSKCLL